MEKYLFALLAVGGLVADPAFAADMPVKVQQAPSAAVSWTGFYAGANIGAAWSNSPAQWTGDVAPAGGAGNAILNIAFRSAIDTSFVPYDQASKRRSVVGGIQAGYNQQWGQFLLGTEGDVQFTNMSSRGSTLGLANGIFAQPRFQQRLDWFGTARARAGMLMWDQRILAYATGGLAVGHAKASADTFVSVAFIPAGITTITCLNVINVPCVAGSSSKTSAGWTAGGGLEMMLAGNARLKIEYLHVDLGDQIVKLVPVPPSTGDGFVNLRFKNAFDVVRMGLNFGF